MAARKRRRPADRPAPPSGASPDRAPLWMPVGLTLLLLAVSLTPRVQESAPLVWSFWAAGASLLLWLAVVARHPDDPRGERALVVVLRPQHYIQAAAQLSVFVYWGWYWRPVYDHAWLIVGQLLFAYVFGMLLAWSRGKPYVLGFGPFPIIFSTNLFLWFRDDWFTLQFVMIAVGFLGKELVTWRRDGRRTHVFNPSAFSLGLFSLVLILTGTTDLTWGVEIATTLTLAPRIYLFLFLVGLVVMYFFSITLVAGSAALVLFGASALYAAITGVPYFVDSEIPTAVFLGLHLLVTDPSTSPRTPGGKTVFGIAYGVGVFALYWLLGAAGVPTFYDKLLCVPLLNLSVQRIDRFVAWLRGPGLETMGVASTTPAASSNLAYMSVWITVFLILTAGGATDGRHRGDTLPFWQEACAEGRRNACERLIQIQTSYCTDGSAWACNELGAHHRTGAIVEADPARAWAFFSRACELRFQAGCLNLLDEERVTRAPPRPLDLRLLLREGGRNLMDAAEADLLTRACAHDWDFACARTTR